MKTQTFTLHTDRQGYYNITAAVKKCISDSGVRSGLCVVFCPHTTAAITINENADPDVRHDLVMGMDGAFPIRSGFQHAEGNSVADLKCMTVGASETIIFADGKAVLGTWQAVYFAEFDGPRTRRYYVKVMSDDAV